MTQTAAQRFLTAQIALGVLDDPPFHFKASAVDSPESRLLALDAASQSLVLLRNVELSGRGKVLPLSRGNKFCFTGPQSLRTTALLGNYHG